ncbi:MULTISPECIES: efflux transporter outer membrane subunit [unclassified Lentimonas]|uniref:efflux transporter outer membrane subunit n=1 Tax=unclassified Lentimonas TaxID=2630993 RepID=UPI001323E3C2|nr:MULTISPECIES: efflux transporter outer membrane subunit [unclassified Lentimonas]CAA6694229.1 RND efflux system, outer membrane lipoprotein CmeC [Lentimonas sp. CC19]CAA6694278.1 RND efflux system, outer membrane lipoprotein CmeC [Lentimonas sp. CC10]CAA7070406.1 RND efflux system, outer membrane lipoprotein CmeC [Lentimonas sp. CC11]
MIHLTQKQLTRCASQSVIALSLLWLSACATTSSMSDTRASFDASLPTTWQNDTKSTSTSDTTDLSEWWSRFNDPQMEALIAEALANNTDSRIALSNIRKARAERGLEEAELWPTLSGRTSASSSNVHDRDTHDSSSSQSYSAGLDASWEVDLFGQQQQYLKASDAELAASVETFYQVQVSLAAEVANTYLDLCAYESRLAIVRDSLSMREDTLRITQWQEDAGEGDSLSTQQSISSVEQARAQIPGLEQSVVETRNSLAILTARTPESFATLATKAAIFPQTPEALAIGIPADTLRQRPDVRTAELQIEAATANLSATERSRLPSLNLSGSIGVEALSSGDLLDPQRILSNIAAGLSAPIWDAGRISRNIEIQNEVLVQSYLSYESTVLNALSEVENALSAIRKRSTQLATLTRATTAAHQASELAQMQYEVGEIDLLTVLETQRTELVVKESRAAIESQALQAHVQLYKSLGGEWSTPAEISQL